MKKTAFRLSLCLVALAISHSTAQDQPEFIRLKSDYTYRMLDHTTEINRKQQALLEEREQGNIKTGNLYLGFDINAIANMQDTNTEAKFGYLMRHPTQNNQGGKSSSELVVHDVKLQLTGAIVTWATAYAEILYNPEQNFGQGTIVSKERNELTVRRAYVLFGDKTVTPFYASLGKMATPFGLTDTVSPFTNSTTWHAFGGLAYGGILGYDAHGLNLSVMGIQGGAQFRSANSGDNTPDDVANYTINGSYEFDFTEHTSLRLGGGYVDGSAYCQGFPVTHFDGCDGFKNPAWNVNSLLKAGRLTVLAEFADTTKDWPGTHNPTPPLNEFEASGVSSLTVGAKYLLPVASLNRDLGVSVEFSDFEAGAEGSPWERQEQLVFGLEMMVTPNLKFFAEYIRTEGYAPLNFISGPDPFDPTENPGTTHSVADAESEIYLIGVRAAM